MTAMTATRRATDTLIIFVVMLLAWQALHQVVGDTALPGPLPTLIYLVTIRPDRALCRERLGDARKLSSCALILSYGHRTVASASGWAFTGCPARSASRS